MNKKILPYVLSALIGLGTSVYASNGNTNLTIRGDDLGKNKIEQPVQKTQKKKTIKVNALSDKEKLQLVESTATYKEICRVQKDSDTFTNIDEIVNRIESATEKDIDNQKFGNFCTTALDKNVHIIYSDAKKENLHLRPENNLNKDTVYYIGNCPKLSSGTVTEVKEGTGTPKNVMTSSTSAPTTSSIEFIYNTGELGAQTNKYNIQGKESGYGARLSMGGMNLGNNWTGTLDTLILSENSDTINKGRNVGNMKKQNLELGLNAKKKIKRTTLNGGFKYMQVNQNEIYAGINAYSATKLAGLNGGIKFDLNKTGNISVAYSGNYLNDNGSTDIKKLGSNSYTVKLGPAIIEQTSTASDSTIAGKQQLYQNGIFGSRLEYGVSTNGGTGFTYSVLNDNNISGSEYKANINLTKKIAVKLNYLEANRNENGKKTPENKTTAGFKVKW